MAVTRTSTTLRRALLSSPASLRPCCLLTAISYLTITSNPPPTTPSAHPTKTRPFSSTPIQPNWLTPRRGESSKSRKGRPKLPTGGSTKGTTLIWGDYGLRLTHASHRISSSQLRIADETIRKRLRGSKYRLYHRVNAGIGVYTSGNDQRMGKGKGTFDHWAARVAVSRVLFEVRGDVHEEVVRDALRLAGNKLPGIYEFVRKGDPPVMGVTKLVNGQETEDMLRRPRMPPTRKADAPKPNLEATARRLPATTGV